VQVGVAQILRRALGRELRDSESQLSTFMDNGSPLKEAVMKYSTLVCLALSRGEH